MASTLSTLPPNTTPLERALARACAALADTPVPLRDLWSPQRCPVALLPFLAWSFSVDRWDDSWPESVKRATIQAARAIHQHKGTIAAVRGAVESLGYAIRIREWWQLDPRGPRGTFALEVGVRARGITDTTFAELDRLIDDAKPLSRHLRGLRIVLEVTGGVFLRIHLQLGETLTVHPWTPDSIDSSGRVAFAAAVHFIDITTINP